MPLCLYLYRKYLGNDLMEECAIPVGASLLFGVLFYSVCCIVPSAFLVMQTYTEAKMLGAICSDECLDSSVILLQ